MQVKKVTPQVKKVPEAVKDQLQVVVRLELSVLNGEDGRPAARWIVINQTLLELSAMKVATTPVLLQTAQQTIPMTVDGFIQGHGAAVTRQLMELQVRAVRTGMVDVIENPAPVTGQEEQRLIIPAK